ncbi:MAG: glycosyltransferase family 39 protein [Dehalococcoidia bacterium]
MAASAPRLTAGHRWLLIGVLLVAALLRLPALDAAPPGVNNDVAFDAVDGLKILDGDLRVWFPGNFGREPIEMYLLAASSALFGRNPLAIRFPTAAAGILAVAAAVPLALRLFRSRPDARLIALLGAAVMAVNFWHVFWSRIGFRSNLLPLVLIVAVWWLARAYDGDQRGWPAAGAAFGAAFYTYTAARLLPLLPVLIVATDALFDRASLRSWLANWLRLAAVAALVILPLGAYFALNPDELLSRVGQLLPIDGADTLPAPADPPDRAILGSLAMFTGDGGGNWVLSLPGRGVFDQAIVPFFIAGVVLALARFRNRAERWLLLWLGVMLLPAIVAREGHPNYGRAIGALPPAMLLTAFGLTEAVEFARRRGLAAPLVAAAATILLLISGVITARDYFLVWALHPEVARAFGVPIAHIAAEANALDDGRAFLLLANPARGDEFSYRAFDYLYDGTAGRTILASERELAAWLASEGKPGRIIEVYDFAPTRHGPDDPRDIADFLLRSAGSLVEERHDDGVRRRVYRLVGAPMSLPLSGATVMLGDTRALVSAAALSADRSALAVAARLDVATGAGAPDRLSFQVFDSLGRPVAQADRPIVDGTGRSPDAWAGPASERVFAIVPLPAGLGPGEYRLSWRPIVRMRSLRLPALSTLSFTLAEPLPLDRQSMTRLDRPAFGGVVAGWWTAAERVRPGDRLPVVVYWQGSARNLALTIGAGPVVTAAVMTSATPQRVLFEAAVSAGARGAIDLLLSADGESVLLGGLPAGGRSSAALRPAGDGASGGHGLRRCDPAGRLHDPEGVARPADARPDALLAGSARWTG